MKKKSNFYLDIGAHLVLIIATIVANLPACMDYYIFD